MNDRAAGGRAESGKTEPLLIKRYASRRLYNTETSDYVTLDDIAGFIRAGRDVQIIDLKTGDDLTRQYLLQIIAEHESRGENVLPLNVLTDLVRSYTDQARSIVPEFLASSFEMIRAGQERMLENMAQGMQAGISNSPMGAIPGFEELQKRQQEFLRAMLGPWATGTTGGQAEREAPADSASGGVGRTAEGEDLDAIKKQLADLQAKLDKLS